MKKYYKRRREDEKDKKRGIYRSRGTTIVAQPKMYIDCDKITLKRVDVNPTVTVIAYQGQIGTYQAELNLITKGTSLHQRVGRKVFLKKLYFKAVIGVNVDLETPVNEADICRISIVYDRQFNGVRPLNKDVFYNVDSSGAFDDTTVELWPNIDNEDRFLFLKDEKIWFPSSGTNDQDNNTGCLIDYRKQKTNIEWEIDLEGLETRYKGSTDTFVDIATGALLLFVMGVHNTDVAPYSLSWTSRLRYTDAWSYRNLGKKKKSSEHEEDLYELWNRLHRKTTAPTEAPVPMQERIIGHLQRGRQFIQDNQNIIQPAIAGGQVLLNAYVPGLGNVVQGGRNVLQMAQPIFDHIIPDDDRAQVQQQEVNLRPPPNHPRLRNARERGRHRYAQDYNRQQRDPHDEVYWGN